MKKKIVFIFVIMAMLFSSCILQVPEKITVKTSPKYNFNIGKFKKSFNNEFAIEKVFKDLESENNRIKVYDYNPNGNSEYQQFLIKVPIQEIPLDFSDFFDSMGLSEEIANLSFSKTVDIPSLKMNEQLPFDVMTLKSSLNGFASASGTCDGSNAQSIAFTGRNNFESITYNSGYFCLFAKNANASFQILHNDEIIFEGFAGAEDSIRFALDNKTIYSDMKIKFDTNSSVNYSIAIEPSSDVAFANGITGKIIVTGNPQVNLGLDDLGVKSCKIGEGFVEKQIYVPPKWTNVSVENTVSLSGAITETFSESILNLNDKDLSGSIVYVDTSSVIYLEKSYLNFSDELKLNIQFNISSFSLIQMELSQDNLSIEKDVPFPTEVRDFVKQITMVNSGVIGTYTNELPTGNDLNISAKSDFIGLNKSSVLKAGQSDAQLNLLSEEEKTQIINDNSTLDFDVDILLPGATKENPNLVTLQNVEAGKSYNLALSLESSIDWTEIVLNKIADGSVKNEMPINFSIKSIFEGIDELLNSSFVNDIEFNSIPLYLYVEKPALSEFDDFKFTNSSIIIEDADSCFMEINNKFAYFPKLQMAENGVTVITDMSKVEYSEKEDLNEVIENDTDENLNIKYDITWQMGNENTGFTFTKADLEKAEGKTSIAIYMALIVPLDFDLRKAQKIDLLKLAGIEYTEGEDLLGRTEPVTNEKLNEILGFIRKASLNYNVKQAPFYSKPSITFDVGFSNGEEQLGDNEVTVGFDKGELDINPVELFNTYPLQPSVTINIPESNFYIARDVFFDVNFGISIEADVELDVFGGDK